MKCDTVPFFPFAYDDASDTYHNNNISTLLMDNHWTQWRNWADLYGDEFYDMARGIPDSLKKDAVCCSAQINLNTDNMFKYFTDQS